MLFEREDWKLFTNIDTLPQKAGIPKENMSKLIIKELVDKNMPYYLISKETGIHPYVVKKTYPQVQQFTLLELKKIYQKIFEVDSSIKTGKIDAEMALDLLITRI